MAQQLEDVSWCKRSRIGQCRLRNAQPGCVLQEGATGGLSQVAVTWGLGV